eukprot:1276939-Lingulodinium_polyedra.AAC.1
MACALRENSASAWRRLAAATVALCSAFLMLHNGTVAAANRPHSDALFLRDARAMRGPFLGVRMARALRENSASAWR